MLQSGGKGRGSFYAQQVGHLQDFHYGRKKGGGIFNIFHRHPSRLLFGLRKSNLSRLADEFKNLYQQKKLKK